MELIIVTGMSGAGKSQTVDALEDMGYYCVDNVPPRLINKFAELSNESGGKIDKIALVVDMRSHGMFKDFLSCLEDLRASNYHLKILFLDCDDKVLLKRYKETRRRHPLLKDSGAVEQAIAEERAMLDIAKQNANFIVDTSIISANQLKAHVYELFADGTGDGMMITCMSFGFKYGIPQDSDLMFDVRCLTNPFYVEELREHNGLDAPVRDFVMGFEAARGLAEKLCGLMDYLVPLYVLEGKSQLVISVGCTGGKHRSVVFAELLARHLAGKGTKINIIHRDIAR